MSTTARAPRRTEGVAAARRVWVPRRIWMGVAGMRVGRVLDAVQTAEWSWLPRVRPFPVLKPLVAAVRHGHPRVRAVNAAIERRTGRTELFGRAESLASGLALCARGVPRHGWPCAERVNSAANTKSSKHQRQCHPGAVGHGAAPASSQRPPAHEDRPQGPRDSCRTTRTINNALLLGACCPSQAPVCTLIRAKKALVPSPPDDVP